MDEPVLPERMLPLVLDLRYPLHRLHRRLHQLAVVADRDVSPLLELNRRVLQCEMKTRDGEGRLQEYSRWSSPYQQPSGMPSSSVPSSGCASSWGQVRTQGKCDPEIRSYLKFLLHLLRQYSDSFSKLWSTVLTLSCRTGRPSHRSGQMRSLQVSSV